MKNIQSFIWLNEDSSQHNSSECLPLDVTDAANFYLDAFKNAKKLSEMPGPDGKPMGVTIEIDDWQFILFNGGPAYNATSGISFFVNVQTEDEITALWNKLSDGGTVRMEMNEYPWAKKYGWVEDKYHVGWQISLTDTPSPVRPSFLFSGVNQGRAEEAIYLYTSQFPNSSVNFIARYEEGEPGPTGKIKFASLTINGQQFAAMDSGVEMPSLFTPGVSLFVNCETQEEVDRLWENLSRDGHQDRCGWLQDKFGVSWQIIPTTLGRFLGDSDRKKAGNVMQAMLGMSKLIIRELEDAYSRT